MSEPLSIVCLSHVASARAATGAERSLALLAGGLARRGHRVTVIVPGKWALADTVTDAGVRLEVQACRVCWLTYWEPRPWPVAAAKWLRWAVPDPGRRALHRRLESLRPDVVHVNCLPHVSGAAAASVAGFPVVWHLREILPEGFRRQWFGGRLRRHARRIVAVSEAVASWVREEGLRDRVDVIHNGVEGSPNLDAVAARREFGLPAEGSLVGLFGQILPHKGPLAFVAAADRALRVDPTLRFVIAGHGPERFLREVRLAVDATGRSDRFHLLGPVSAGDRLAVAADVVCLTTITPDPFPRTVLEAMAAARPVVAFRSGGTEEMVEHGKTGLLVDTGDVAALASALLELAGSPEKCTEMGAAGAARARSQFSLERHVERMESVLCAVAGECERSREKVGG